MPKNFFCWITWLLWNSYIYLRLCYVIFIYLHIANTLKMKSLSFQSQLIEFPSFTNSFLVFFLWDKNKKCKYLQYVIKATPKVVTLKSWLLGRIWIQDVEDLQFRHIPKIWLLLVLLLLEALAHHYIFLLNTCSRTWCILCSELWRLCSPAASQDRLRAIHVSTLTFL